METTTRNATLADMATLLKEQHARKIDMVVPASKIRSEDGIIVVKGADAVIDEDGVTEADGRYRPTAVFDEGISGKLGIPLKYVRDMRASRTDLYDANVNGWLHGRKPKGRWVSGIAGDADAVWEERVPGIPGDQRKFMVRAYRGDDGEQGIARALLSDRYGTMDNLDVLTAALDGVRQAGVDVSIEGCDLSDRRMYVRVVAPEVTAVAATLLRDYRNPFAGTELAKWREVADREGLGYGGEEPIVFAGFEISNSEVGDGAFSIVPRIVLKVCKNGLKITQDVLRKTHLGGRLEEGVIRWSADTQSKNLALVTAQARDAVATFLDVEYVVKAVDMLEEKAGVRLDKPADDVKTVCKRLKFDDATIDGVLGHFIAGGQTTAGGLMNAVTSYAQIVDDADVAAELEAQAVNALHLASVLR